MKVRFGSGAFLASALLLFQPRTSAQRTHFRGRFKKFLMPGDDREGDADIDLFDGGPSIRCAMRKVRGRGNPWSCQEEFTSVTVVETPCSSIDGGVTAPPIGKGDGGGMTPPIGKGPGGGRGNLFGRHVAPRTSPRMDWEERGLFGWSDRRFKDKKSGRSKTCYSASIVDGANGKVYHVNRDGDVTERDEADYPPEEQPHVDRRERERALARRDGGQTVEVGGGGRALQSTPVIDVLVVYTQAAKAGALHDGDGPIEDIVNLAFAETNGAFVNSGINAEIRLAHLQEDLTNYTGDVDSTSIVPALYHATFQAGDQYDPTGELDYIHQKREEVGADMVALIVGGVGCGVAWVSGDCVGCLPSKANQFSVIKYSCATGYYSFGHELGHNLGARHDKGTEGACGSTDYRYGYRDPGGRFRSILSYSCATYQCDENPGGPCTRSQFFSTPDPNYLWNGQPMGAGSSDTTMGETNNAKRIGEVAQHVANFYGEVVDCTDDPNWVNQNGENCDYIGRARVESRCNHMGTGGVRARDACPEQCNPSCQPTASPTPAPTVSARPSAAPSASAAPSIDCTDDPNWVNRKEENCDYIGSVPARVESRCNHMGTGGVRARDACPEQCNPGCQPTSSPTPSPTPAPTVSASARPSIASSTIAAPSAGPSVLASTSAAPSIDCTNDPNWVNVRGENCDYIGQVPARVESRCNHGGTGGVRAYDACPKQCDAACGGCCTW